MKQRGLVLFCCLIATISFSQNLQITIVDETNNPLEGATIFDDSQQWNAFTDYKGQALIPENSTTIEVTYLGFESQRVRVSDLKQLPTPRVRLTNTVNVLEQAIVVGRRGELLEELPYQVKRIDAATIHHLQSSSTVDALADYGGVFVQKSQLGGGSPILRGFEANRVLLVLDGVRMNNAIYRSGHLQNAITVDEAALDALEVIFGAGSLSYGSDALGGVIHFKTKRPSFRGVDEKAISANLGLQYGSAANQKIVQTGFQYHGKKIATYTAFTVSDFGDLTIGKNNQKEFSLFGQRPAYIAHQDGKDLLIPNSNPYQLIGSAYQQLDLLQKIRWKIRYNLELETNFQYSTSSDIPRYDRLTAYRNGQLRFAEWYYGPQNRLLAAATLHWQANRKWADHAQLIIAHQFVEEDRFERAFQNYWREASLVDVSVQNLNLDFKKRLNPSFRIDYGLDAAFNTVSANAFQQHILTNEVDPFLNARYPDGGSTLFTSGIYSQLKIKQPGSNWHAEAGARWAWQQLKTQFTANTPIEWPSSYTAGIQANSQAFTWAAGFHWQPQQWQFKALIATGFRAPNVDDFAKFREKGGFIQIPNIDLEAEKSLTAEISLARQLGPAKWSATVFHTWLKNSITRQNYQFPDGNSWLISRGDSLRVQANVNTGQAKIWGVSTILEAAIGSYWTLAGGLNFTHGERPFDMENSRQVTVPLDHIPPLYGHLSLSFEKPTYKISLRSKFQSAKPLSAYAVSDVLANEEELIFDRTGTTDNLEQSPQDRTTSEYLGAQAWQILSLNSSWTIYSNIKLLFACENIFDQSYRPFASGIHSPGRNFLLGANLEF